MIDIINDHVFVVAEISANHGHDISIVKDSIRTAKEIGCDGVKIQTYLPETLTLDCDSDCFRLNTGTIWDGKTLYELYSEGYMPWEWHEELYDYARSQGIILFSTPFDSKAVDLLEKCDNPIYKIASFEANHIPLIKYAASKKKPMIISTGISTEYEIEEAIRACKDTGNDQVYLLKCTSQYPAEIRDANLNTMVDMRERFQVQVGLSDHTEGSIVAVTAAALGAAIIEKHFILDKSIGGPDASFSMEPGAFEDMIRQIRLAEEALGRTDYRLDPKKQNSRKYARSIFVAEDVKKGDIVTEDNIAVVRPSDGLEPKYYYDVLGKRFKDHYKKGTPLGFDCLV